MPQKRHKGLGTSIDPETSPTESNSGTPMHNVEGRQLVQFGLFDNQRETSIAAGYRMADPVTFMGIEKEHLVRFRHRLIMSDMVHLHNAVRQYKLCRGRRLLGAH